MITEPVPLVMPFQSGERPSQDGRKTVIINTGGAPFMVINADGLDEEELAEAVIRRLDEYADNTFESA